MKQSQAILVASLLPFAVSAQEVTLRSNDGNTTVTGVIEDVDETAYRLRTTIGVVDIPIANVECIGEACPFNNVDRSVIPTEPVSFDVVVENPTLRDVLPALTEAFSEARGAGLSRQDDGDGAPLTLALEPTAFSPQMTINVVQSGGTVDPEQAKMFISSADYPVGVADGGDDVYSSLGLDALIVLTDDAVTVDAVSLDDLSRIYAGELVNWSELGGPDLPITPLVPDAESGDFDALIELVLEPYGRTLSDNVIPVNASLGVDQATALFEGGVGLAHFGEEGDAKIMALAGSCGTSALPGSFEIKSGAYPLTRSIIATYDTETAGQAGASLISFAKSEDGQRQLAARTGFVGHEIVADTNTFRIEQLSRIEMTDGEKIMALSMVQSLEGYDHLSPTFRFQEGSFDLDMFSSTEMERLVSYLRGSASEISSLHLVGFSDGSGDVASAVGAADMVGETLIERLQEGGTDLSEVLTTSGYAGIAPVACSDVPNSSYLNNRVEIWVNRS